MTVVEHRNEVAYAPGPLDRDATFYVAGHRGLVGSAIWRKLEFAGFQRLVGKTSAELDLKDRAAVFDYLGEIKPRYVVLAAARVGGFSLTAPIQSTSSATTYASRSTCWTPR